MTDDLLRQIILICNYFFTGYLVFYTTYMLISGIYGSVQMYRYRKMELLHNVLEHEFYYPISIIVPAYNEGETAVQTVKNLLKLDYKIYEIVVINDGSKDNTKELLIEAFSLVKEEERPIRYAVPCETINEVYTNKIGNVLITLGSKDNGGCKADAVNAGINLSAYPYVVNMDGDEILQKDALKYASRAILEDDNVIGVGGNLKISNAVTFADAMPVSSKLGTNLLVDMQVLEYGRGFIGSKIFQNRMNTNLIISGGYGVFNKAAVIEVGGYDTNSMGEDMELTMKLHQHYRKNKKKYTMKYVPNSVCWTQGPSTMKDLRRQRERWHCGLIQTLSKYKGMILNPRYGLIGMFMLPYVIMYELLSPIFLLIGWGVILLSVMNKTINVPFVLYIYLLCTLFGIILTMVSYLDKAYMKKDGFKPLDIVKSFFIAAMDSFFFRPYLLVIAFFSFFKVKKVASKWVSPSRVKVESLDE